MWTNERWCFRMLFYWATLLINKHNIPIVIMYRKDKKQEFWGSTRAKSKLQNYYSNSLSFRKGFSEDQNDLNMPGTFGHITENPENVHVRQILENRTGDAIPAKLPSKLSLCRLPQLGPYIGEEMMRQYRMRGGKLKKKCFGKAEFKMDDWDDSVWPWPEVKGWKNAKDFPKTHGTQTDFYRKYIENLFHTHNLDPETWVEKRSSATKSKEHAIKKRNREQVLSDSDSDQTSVSSSSHNRSRSLSSSEDGEIRTISSVLPTITEAENEMDEGVLADSEQEDGPPIRDTEGGAESATSGNILPEQSLDNIPPLTPDPVLHTQVEEDRNSSYDPENSYEEINCDNCKISSTNYNGRWHQNQSCEAEYLCEPCVMMIRNRQASLTNPTRQTSVATNSSSHIQPSPRRARRPTHQENNVTPMLLRLRSRHTPGI